MENFSNLVVAAAKMVDVLLPMEMQPSRQQLPWAGRHQPRRRQLEDLLENLVFSTPCQPLDLHSGLSRLGSTSGLPCSNSSHGPTLPCGGLLDSHNLHILGSASHAPLWTGTVHAVPFTPVTANAKSGPLNDNLYVTKKFISLLDSGALCHMT